MLQVACMQFINIAVHSVEDVNYRVHLQHEFTLLGLDSYLDVCNVSVNFVSVRYVAWTAVLMCVCVCVCVCDSGAGFWFSLSTKISFEVLFKQVETHIRSCTSSLSQFFFNLNSSLTFSSPLSLLCSIIPYTRHTLFRFNSFFFFLFFLFLVCSFLSLFDVIMFGAPELWW